MKRKNQGFIHLLCMVLVALLLPIGVFAEGEPPTPSMDVTVLPATNGQEEMTVPQEPAASPEDSIQEEPAETIQPTETVPEASALPDKIIPPAEEGEETNGDTPLEELPTPEPSIDFEENPEDIPTQDTQPIDGLPSLLRLATYTDAAGLRTARYKHQIVTDNGVMYAVGGDSTASKTIDAYDAESNTWRFVTGIEHPRSGMKAIAYDGVIYLIGGYENGVFQNRVDAYSIADNTWEEKASLPERMERCAAAAVDGTIYVMGGRNDKGLSNRQYQYDIASDTWTKRANMPVAMMDGALYYLQGRLYLTMGFTKDGYSQRMYEYNLQGYGWKQKTGIGLNVTDSKTAMQYASFGVNEQNNIYVLANTVSGQKILSSYDVNSDTWTQREIVTDSISYYDIGILDGTLYVTGGLENGAATGKVTTYEIPNSVMPDFWQEQNPMRTSRAKQQSIVIGEDLYVIGGRNGSSNLTSIENYNAQTFSWSSVTNMPEERKGYTTLAVDDRKLFVIGGYKDGCFTKRIDVYDTKTGAWSALSMKHGRERAAAVQVGNQIHIVGGRNEFGIVKEIETYDLTTGKWSERIAPDENLLRYDMTISYLEGRLYQVGGFDRDGYISNIYIFDTNFAYKGMKFLDGVYDEFHVAPIQNKLILFARSNRMTGYETYELVAWEGEQAQYQVRYDILRQPDIAQPLGDIKYADIRVYDGYLYFMGGYDTQNNRYLNTVRKYTKYYGPADPPEISESSGTTWNAIEMETQKGQEYEFYIQVNEVASFADWTFRVTFQPGEFSLSDACAMTQEKVKTSGMVQGTDIEIVSASNSEVQFKVHKAIPEGQVYSGAVNIVRFKAEKSGTVNLKYQMDARN
jgi:N-acetylneuraminic acid mutarotase